MFPLAIILRRNSGITSPLTNLLIWNLLSNLNLYLLNVAKTKGIKTQDHLVIIALLQIKYRILKILEESECLDQECFWTRRPVCESLLGYFATHPAVFASSESYVSSHHSSLARRRTPLMICPCGPLCSGMCLFLAIQWLPSLPAHIE